VIRKFDATDAHPEQLGERAGGFERGRAASVDRAVRAVELRPGAHDAEQRMHRESLVRREQVERCRRAHVADERTGWNRRSRRGDLAVGNAEQHEIVAP
jgi:hypothetical protein